MRSLNTMRVYQLCAQQHLYLCDMCLCRMPCCPWPCVSVGTCVTCYCVECPAVPNHVYQCLLVLLNPLQHCTVRGGHSQGNSLMLPPSSITKPHLSATWNQQINDTSKNVNCGESHVFTQKRSDWNQLSIHPNSSPPALKRPQNNTKM